MKGEIVGIIKLQLYVKMKKLMFIFGTRPEFIKIYPIIIEAINRKQQVVIVNTGQHKEMVNELLDYFDMKVDYDLQIMNKCDGLTDILKTSIEGLDEIVKVEVPDIILVHGDTSATLAGSIVALYNQVKLAHIEAGLRTYNKMSPFPEEANRQLTGVIADYHFAPTVTAKNNLLNEGKNEDDIYVVGNSAIDMLNYTIDEKYDHSILNWHADKKLILMTAHRRENIEDLEQMFKAINYLADKYNKHYKIVYPIHLNPKIRDKAKKYLTASNLKIIEPLDTVNFHNIIRHAHLILTDSGGIQEEAPSFGVPVLVLRDTTERPEGVLAGTLKLVGTKYEKIIEAVDLLLTDEDEYLKMRKAINPYGKGDTAKQILDILCSEQN